MGEVVELFPVDSAVILRHERVLVKQMLHVFSEGELMQGPMDKHPRKSVEVPDYTGPQKMKDESTSAYRMIQTDLLGERKISTTGELMGDREYLCQTFKLNEAPNRYVLVSHLINTLGYEGNAESFLTEFDQLLPMELASDIKDVCIEKKFLSESEGDVKYVTFRSAFVQFGAALVACGERVFDDYWETIAKRQGLTAHHRVFKLSKRLVSKLMILNPHIFAKEHQQPATLLDDGLSFESPWLTVVEQTSLDVRQQWGKEMSYGEHINAVVPGQSIHGSLDLSAQCKIPKYHSKNSFQQAVQMKALDLPIGSDVHSTAVRMPIAKQENTPAIPQPARKTNNRILNSILDSGTSNKAKKPDDLEESVGHIVPGSTNETLNINGWKFDSLPLRSAGTLQSQRSLKGLPFYDQDKLVARVKKLTPNQVQKIEHIHDSVFLNVGLQTQRNTRSQKWSKYWQYKSGIPVGLLRTKVDYFKDQYLKDVLEETSSVTNYIAEKNVDEIDITTREANANYIGHSNIHGFRPPYRS